MNTRAKRRRDGDDDDTKDTKDDVPVRTTSRTTRSRSKSVDPEPAATAGVQTRRRASTSREALTSLAPATRSSRSRKTTSTIEEENSDDNDDENDKKSSSSSSKKSRPNTDTNDEDDNAPLIRVDRKPSSNTVSSSSVTVTRAQLVVDAPSSASSSSSSSSKSAPLTVSAVSVTTRAGSSPPRTVSLLSTNAARPAAVLNAASSAALSTSPSKHAFANVVVAARAAAPPSSSTGSSMQSTSVPIARGHVGAAIASYEAGTFGNRVSSSATIPSSAVAIVPSRPPLSSSLLSSSSNGSGRDLHSVVASSRPVQLQRPLSNELSSSVFTTTTTRSSSLTNGTTGSGSNLFARLDRQPSGGATTASSIPGGPPPLTPRIASGEVVGLSRGGSGENITRTTSGTVLNAPNTPDREKKERDWKAKVNSVVRKVGVLNVLSSSPEEPPELPPHRLVLAAKVPPSVPLPELLLLNDPNKPEIIFGRSSTSDVILVSKLIQSTISRTHAKIVRDAHKGWTIVDLKSLNGIYINDKRVTDHLLKDGDIITFGGPAESKIGQYIPQPMSEFVYRFEKIENKGGENKDEEEESTVVSAFETMKGITDNIGVILTWIGALFAAFGMFSGESDEFKYVAVTIGELGLPNGKNMILLYVFLLGMALIMAFVFLTRKKTRR